MEKIKLDTPTIQLIKDLVKTSQLIGVERAIIDEHGARGLHPEQDSGLLKKDMPELPFTSLPINRVPVLASRLSIIETAEVSSIHAELKDDGSVRSLIMKGDRINVDFLCGVGSSILGPKNYNDSFMYEFKFNAEAIRMLIKGKMAMQNARLVTFIGNDDGIAFELLDVNSDVFRYEFPNKAENIVDDHEPVSFVHRYSVDMLLALCKQDSEATVQVGDRLGLMKFRINDFDTVILPRVN